MTTPLPDFPLTADDCRRVVTPQIDRMLAGAAHLFEQAEFVVDLDFPQARDIQDMAVTLQDEAYRLLCVEFVEADEREQIEMARDEAYTREINYPM
jgi:hypothetical protein